jgi:hypothetical protein
MAVTYIEKITASDLTLGGTATREMSAGTGTDTNFNVAPANGGGTETHFFVTPPSKPNNDQWETDDDDTWFCEVEVDTGDAEIDCQVRVGRCDSGGTILQTGAFTAAQDMSVTRSFSPAKPTTWTGGEEACGNRLFMELLFTNNASHGSHSVDIGVGTAANEAGATGTFVEDSSGCVSATVIKDVIMGPGIIPFPR